MERRHSRNVDTDPEEVIELPRVRSEIVTVGSMTLAREFYQPGWRWSEDIKPIVGTDSCRVQHLGYVLKGRLGVRLDGGEEFEVAPGDAFEVPPGHDGWVIGDESAELITWSGARTWITPLDTLAERVVATIVFADIVDSTVTARRLGDRVWSEINAMFEIAIRDAVVRYRGRVIKTTGDGLLATFDGAARGIRSAMAMQAAATDFGLGLRTAVHSGEVELTTDDIRGLAIHEASRMVGLADPGEVLVSATTHDLARDAGISFDDRGEHELRGLEGARRMFAVRG